MTQAETATEEIIQRRKRCDEVDIDCGEAFKYPRRRSALFGHRSNHVDVIFDLMNAY